MRSYKMFSNILRRSNAADTLNHTSLNFLLTNFVYVSQTSNDLGTI